jgi:hypothetical protein
MPVTINGTTGVVTPNVDATSANAGTLTVGSITGLLKASSGAVSQANVGTDYSQLTLATAQTASGTAVDFTGIPSWVKRITVMFNGVSTNGSSAILIQIGSGSISTTGYTSVGGVLNFGTGSTQVSSSTSGFCIHNVAAYSIQGHMQLTLVSANSWVSSHVLFTGQSGTGGGSVTLSGTLDRIRLTTVNGTDTFDAGTINISYE